MVVEVDQLRRSQGGLGVEGLRENPGLNPSSGSGDDSELKGERPCTRQHQ